MPPAHGQQGDLRFQGLYGVKARGIQDAADVRQGEFQRPEQEDGVQALQRVLVIEPIARLRRGAGAQQADAVVVPQGAHTQVGDAAHFADGHHGSGLLSSP